MENVFNVADGVKQHIDARVVDLQKRGIKSQSKMDLLRLAVSMIDLTVFERVEAQDKVQQICLKAKDPIAYGVRREFLSRFHNFPEISPVAAVCVYPPHIKTALLALAGSGVKVAAVAAHLPTSSSNLDLRLFEIRQAVSEGANEVDMVINQSALMTGCYQQVYDEIAAAKEICRDSVRLKVILETGELGTFENIRMASFLAMEAGADFIKLSSGKYAKAATMESTLVMLRAIFDFFRVSNKKVGMKPDDGVKTAKQAIQYLVMAKEVLGETWLTADRFRFSASSLLNDLLRQICKESLGYYFYDNVFAAD